MTEIIIDEPFLSGDVFVKRRKRIIAFAISFFVFCAFAVGLSLFLYFHFRDTPKDDPKSVNTPKDKVIPAVLPDPVPRIPEEKIIPGPGVKPDIVVTNPEDQKGRTTDPLKPKDVIKNPMSADEVYQELADVAAKKNYTVVKGTFYDCSTGSCVYPSGKFIEEWKLRYAAKILDGKPNLDMEYEFDTILQFTIHNMTHGMSYRTGRGYVLVLEAFRKSKKLVEEHNSDPNRLFNLELNKLATSVRPEQTMFSPPESYLKPTSRSPSKEDLSNQDIHVDWRTSEFDPGIGNQGGCGSCWAMATVRALSMFYSRKKGKKVLFSVQQPVDCVGSFYNCQRGGSPAEALRYYKDNKMCLEEEYPYRMKKTRCEEKKCKIDTEISEIVSLQFKDPLEFLKKHGPFVTSLPINRKFELYSDGIYNVDCGYGGEHAVVVVGHGYDKVKKVDYWIVANSWNTNWGEDGYFRIIDSYKMVDGYKQRHCDFILQAFGLV